MKPIPWVPISISKILAETEDGLQVLTHAGRTPWLPKRHIDYTFGAVLVPEWLAQRILQSRRPHEAGR